MEVTDVHKGQTPLNTCVGRGTDSTQKGVEQITEKDTVECKTENKTKLETHTDPKHAGLYEMSARVRRSRKKRRKHKVPIQGLDQQRQQVQNRQGNMFEVLIDNDEDADATPVRCNSQRF